MEIETKKIQLGDQLQLNLRGIGLFTATAHSIETIGVRFMFDDDILSCGMNKYPTNIGGYEKSRLFDWINNELKNAFPDELKSRIIDISLPSYGQIFGHDGYYKDTFEPDNDVQFQLMSIRRNRIGIKQQPTDWYWIKNATKKEISNAKFAIGSGYGGVSFGVANGQNGVRPTFLLVI